MRLHHIGVVVGDIQKAAAEYAVQYGYEVRSNIVHDEEQTALVQFLRLPGDAVYLELVSPDGPDSRLSAALKRGGGLNHLCYATDDIERTCADMRRRGWVIIHPPVAATAFEGRRIAWLMGRDRVLTELVEAPSGDQEL